MNIQKFLNLLLSQLVIFVSLMVPFSISAKGGDTLSLFQNQLPLQSCTEMFVDLSTACLVPCTSSDYYVRYCNFGDEVANDAFVTVEFDSTFSVNGATLPFSNPSGNVYIFNLGDVAPSDCGSFSINITLACDAVPGQAHCVEAQIFPSETCEPPASNWDSSNIEVNIACQGDSIYFTLQNTGNGDMGQSSQFIIIEDDVIVMLNGYYLPSGGDTIFVLPNNGGFYHFEAGQTPNNPNGFFASSSTEGCNVITPGFLTQYPEDDGTLSYEQTCLTNNSSCTLNNKIAFPIGVNAEHEIGANQQLQYQINFQNTTTDTAHNVIVCDTLSSFLDISTLIGGASSFDFTVENLGNNVFKFIFENIDLPPDGSGFVKFQIDQLPDNPPCTRIENWARIFFDQDSVLTDTFFHTISCGTVITDTTIVLCGGGGYYAGTFYNQNASVSNTTNFSTFTSVLNTEIVVYPGTPDETVTATICEGQTYEFNGQSFSAAGSYSFPMVDANGCPYTLTLVLIVEENTETITYKQICEGGVCSFHGQDYSNSGVYSHAEPNGVCFDIDILVLTVNPVFHDTLYASNCQGDLLVWNGEVVNTDTLITHYYLNQFGCSSDSVLVLTVFPNSDTTFDATICEGDLFYIGANAYGMAGTFTDTLQSIHNCDSIVTVNLTVLSISETGLAAVICLGESYEIGDSTYTESGTYITVLSSSNGCDSIVTLELIVQAKDSLCFANAGLDTSTCGFVWTLVGTPSFGEWEAVCNSSAGFVSLETTNDSTAIASVSECGTYYFKYTHTHYDTLVVFDSLTMVLNTIIDTCTASDFIRVDFEDPSYRQININIDLGLIYNNYTCHDDDGVTCSNLFPFDQVVPIPSWKFGSSASCNSDIVEPVIGNVISECLVTDIIYNQLGGQASTDFPVICVGQDAFIELDSTGQEVENNGFFGFLDSLFLAGYNSIESQCPPAPSKCFAPPLCLRDTLGLDTSYIEIPVHLGGQWTYIDSMGQNVPLQDTSFLEINNQDFALIIAPNANTYSPVTFELWKVLLNDSLIAPSSAVIVTVQWQELWTFDSIEIVTAILSPLPDSCLPICQSLGGTFLTYLGIPDPPSFDCPPFTITFGGTKLELTDSIFCDTNSYTVQITIAGGTPPYTLDGLDGNFISTNVFLSSSIPLNMGYSATVTDAEGCKDIITGESCRCNVYEAQTLSSVEANCVDSCVILNGFPIGQGNGWLAQWCFGDNLIANETTVTVCEPGTYTFKVTDSNSGCRDSSLTTVYVNLPEAEAGPNMTLTCTQNTAILLGDELTGDSMVVFAWEGQGINAGNENQQQPIVAEPGLYILTVTNTETGCFDTDTVSVFQNSDMPNTIIALPSILNCFSPTQELNGNNSTPVGQLSFSWASVNGNILSGQNTSFPLINQAGIYVLTVTNILSGCTDMAEVNVQADFMLPQLVNAGPDMQLDCGHDDQILQGSVASSNNLTIHWSTNNGNIVSGENTLMPLVDTLGTYSLTISNTLNGCSSEDEAIVVADFNYPIASILIPDTLNCIETTLVLNGQNSSTGIDIFYEWQTDNGNLTASVNGSTSSIDAPGNYYLIVLDTSNGCKSIDMVVVAENIAQPIANAGLDTYFSCKTDSLKINATQSSTGGNISYHWQSLNGNIANGATTAAPWIATPGTFVLQVTDENNGCVNYDTVKIEAYEPVSFNLAITPDCQNSDIGSVSVVNLKGQADMYVFELDNGLVRYDSLFSDLPSGNYTLTVRDLDSCLVQLDFEIAEVPPLPQQSFEETYHFCGKDSPLMLDATANIDSQWVSYFWSNGEVMPNIIINEEGAYSVEISTGCETQLYEFEIIDDLRRADFFEMPNVFSPNGDDVNDVFRPVSANELEDYKMVIFDRWGEKIFESNKSQKYWDGTYNGKPASSDVYIWKVFAKYKDCVEMPHQFSLKGDVTLLR